MGSNFDNRNDDQDKIIKNLSEQGGYLFIPEEDYFECIEEENSEEQQEQEKGVVLKIEKGGKISDAVLSFGYKKTRLNKENILGLSIENIKKHNIPLTTSTIEETDKCTPKVIKTISGSGKPQYDITFEKTKEIPPCTIFNHRKMREASQKEYDKYKNMEEVRNLRYNRALEPSDPLEEKLEYADAKRKMAPKNEDQEKAVAKGVAKYNCGNTALKRLVKLNKQKIAAKKRAREM